jgi:hypothetical protein
MYATGSDDFCVLKVRRENIVTGSVQDCQNSILGFRNAEASLQLSIYVLYAATNPTGPDAIFVTFNQPKRETHQLLLSVLGAESP